jgi:hypothetical protein
MHNPMMWCLLEHLLDEHASILPRLYNIKRRKGTINFWLSVRMIIVHHSNIKVIVGIYYIIAISKLLLGLDPP